MKTKEELLKIKEEYESLASKLFELSEDEIVEITGGDSIFDLNGNQTLYDKHLYENTVKDPEDFKKKF